MKPVISKFASAILLMGLLPGGVRALEVISSVEYTAEHTDNTLLTEDNRISDWIHNPGLDFYAAHDTASVELLADYNYVRQIYDKDFYDDQNLVSGTASVRWEALPQRLDLNLRNVVTQSALRASGPTTPDNRQAVSYTEVGPTLRFQPRSGDELQLEYLFTDVNASDTDTDSTRNTGTARYILGISDNRAFEIDTSYTEVDFDNPFSADLDTLTATGTYRQTGSSLDLELTAGYANFDRDGLSSVDGGIYQAALTWRRNATSRLTFTGSDTIRDTASDLTSGSGGDGATSPDNSDLNEVFRESRAELAWAQEIGATSASIGGFYVKEAYEDETIMRDNDGVGAFLRLSRRLTQQTTLSGSIDYTSRNYTDEGDDQDEIRAELDLTRLIGRRLALTAGVRYQDRDSTSFDSYDELLASIGVSYTFWGNRDSPR